jgi:hypothetical protein
MMDIELFPQIEGKKVVRAVKSRDNHGYDILAIEFTDGSRFGIQEMGQIGYFTCHFVEGRKK